MDTLDRAIARALLNAHAEIDRLLAPGDRDVFHLRLNKAAAEVVQAARKAAKADRAGRRRETPDDRFDACYGILQDCELSLLEHALQAEEGIDPTEAAGLDEHPLEQLLHDVWSVTYDQING